MTLRAFGGRQGRDQGIRQPAEGDLYAGAQARSPRQSQRPLGLVTECGLTERADLRPGAPTTARVNTPPRAMPGA